jgi:hypothetical protein
LQSGLALLVVAFLMALNLVVKGNTKFDQSAIFGIWDFLSPARNRLEAVMLFYAGATVAFLCVFIAMPSMTVSNIPISCTWISSLHLVAIVRVRLLPKKIYSVSFFELLLYVQMKLICCAVLSFTLLAKRTQVGRAFIEDKSDAKAGFMTNSRWFCGPQTGNRDGDDSFDRDAAGYGRLAGGFFFVIVVRLKLEAKRSTLF